MTYTITTLTLFNISLRKWVINRTFKGKSLKKIICDKEKRFYNQLLPEWYALPFCYFEAIKNSNSPSISSLEQIIFKPELSNWAVDESTNEKLIKSFLESLISEAKHLYNPNMEMSWTKSTESLRLEQRNEVYA